MKVKKERKKKKGNSNIKWYIEVTLLTFILSMFFSYISANGVSNLSILPATLILILVVMVGIVADMIGISVTVANEEEFHAKATKKIAGSKTSIELIKRASKVASISSDVIGDICGVLSGAIGTMIAMKIVQTTGASENIQFLISALIACIMVGGKAIGKDVGIANATKIVHTVGKGINKVSLKKQ